jgi:DNA repair protein RadC
MSERKHILERLQENGVETLNMPELLTIILRTGTARDNAMELATKMLSKYGGIGGLVSAGFHELSNDLGPAKTAQLKAALEIGKRLSTIQPDKKYQIRSADDAANLVRMQMMYLDHEEMHVLVMDTKNQVREHVKSYKGTVNSSVLRAAEIFRPAVVRNCPHVIVCHNHPSGDPTPSPEDIEVTKQLAKAAELLDIELLDHIIIGNPRYVSLKERLRW